MNSGARIGVPLEGVILEWASGAAWRVVGKGREGGRGGQKSRAVNRGFEVGDLGLNPGYVITWLCDLGQIIPWNLGFLL